MDKEHLAVAGLRVFLVVLFAALVFFQVVSLPGQFAYMAEQDPGHAYLRWPLTAVTAFWVLCAQVVIVAPGSCSPWSRTTASSVTSRSAG